ncbi:TraB/GumN family protein [Lewinella sp. IMCC34183]|uniref:TraB/GumN family protein n=1 Tax=Lewinella sp. IMCC34183 TaxID=2248762 RepID=UPI0013007BF3|nr:TraB/GumN family protein [Lewinella sp. IMCC34183]
MRVLRTLFALFVLTLLPGMVLRAQVADPETDAALADAPFQVPTVNDTSLLWRITGADVAEPSYLYGTIHIIPEEDYFLDNHVVRAANDVEALFFEIDPREMQNPAAIMGLMGKITMRNDTSLQDLLSPARYDSVATYFNDRGMPFFIFQKMKPMFLSAMVGQDMGAGNPFGGGDPGAGMGGMRSYELELSKIAEAAGKDIAGLETMDFQLGLFDSIPYSIQAEMLYRSISDDMAQTMTDGDSQMDQMVAMYKRRAVAEMSQLISSESEGFGNFEELLVVRRNEKWVPEIAARLTASPTLYAVGAGHLGGERGVIALLRAEGLTVEPVYE